MAQPDADLGISVDFPSDDFRNAIRFAMQMGKNPDATRQVIFIKKGTALTYWLSGVQQDEEDVPRDRDQNPLNPLIEVRRAADVEVDADCAVEVEPQQAADTGVGIFRPTRITLTLLDVDYAKVKAADCRECLYNGDRFVYSYEPESDGLFDVGVYQMVFTAKEDT